MLHRSTEHWAAANRSKGSLQLSQWEPSLQSTGANQSVPCIVLSCHVTDSVYVLHVMRQNCSSTLKTFWDYYKNDGWFNCVVKINLQDLIWLKFNHVTADDMSYLVVKFQTDWPKKIFLVNLQKFKNWTLVSLSRGARRARRAPRTRLNTKIFLSRRGPMMP